MRAPKLLVTFLVVGMAMTGCSAAKAPASAGGAAALVPVANFLERPKVGVWKIETPFATEVKDGDSSVSEALQSIDAVAADQALALWTLSKDLDNIDKQQISLVDTKSGRTMWTRNWSGSFKIVSAFGTRDVVLRGDQGLTSIDRSNGHTISQTKSKVDATDAGLGSVIPASKILLTTNNVINLYATSDLTSPLWKVGIPASNSISGYSHDRLFTQKASYSISSGEKLQWGGALGSDIEYFPGDTAWSVGSSSSELLRFEGGSSKGTLNRVSPNDGSSMWQIEISNTQHGIAFDSDGVLVLKGHTLTKYSGADGKKIWSQGGGKVGAPILAERGRV